MAIKLCFLALWAVMIGAYGPYRMILPTLAVVVLVWMVGKTPAGKGA